jgi:hypothetical protein
MTSTTMTPTPQVPLCRDQAFKDEMVQRISMNIEAEVRDLLNRRFADGDLDHDLYQDELSAMLSYLDDNLSIFIK